MCVRVCVWGLGNFFSSFWNTFGEGVLGRHALLSWIGLMTKDGGSLRGKLHSNGL